MSIINTTEKTFEKDVLEKEKALVYFGAEWCPYCVILHPKLEEIASGTPDFVLADINVDDDMPLVEKYNVELYPTVIKFVNGEAVGRLVASPDPDKPITIDDINNLMK